MASQFTKDPEAVLDFGVDWSQWLGDDSIQTSTWLASEGLTIDTNRPAVSDGARTKVWISGGTAGSVYTLTNRITTTQGRQDDRSMTIRVMQT